MPRDPLKRFWLGFRFHFERLLIRGPLYRLLIPGALIVVASVVGGLLALNTAETPGYGDSVWWAFLRLTDPGYLGDDQGAFRRLVSTVLTVLGYVLFMGSLVAIMTQWFQSLMKEFESGTTPVSMKGHFIVLGWTNRTEAIVRELLVSEARVRRFYERIGRRSSLDVVILSDSDLSKVREDIQQVVGRDKLLDRIVVRAGTPLRTEHLERVDYLNASAIILPSNTALSESVNIDASTIKTLLSMSQAVEGHLEEDDQRPFVVAEIADDRKISLGRQAYKGPLECLATDRMIARALAQNVRHRGLSRVYSELFGHSDGSELYIRDWTRDPVDFGALVNAFDGACVIGFLESSGQKRTIRLNPDLSARVTRGDSIITVSRDYATSSPDRAHIGSPTEARPRQSPTSEEPPVRRVLVLGWSEKVALLLHELSGYRYENYEITSVSVVPVEEREREIEQRVGDLDRVDVTMIEADFASARDLKELDVVAFDEIVITASDWLESDELSDARTLLGYLAIHELLGSGDARPDLIVELIDPENEHLLGTESDVIVSTLMVSRMLTHVALRRELGGVFDELFGPSGVDLIFADLERYELEPGDYTFEEIRDHVAARGDLAVGYRAGVETTLNPPKDDQRYLNEDSRIIAVTTL